jgi:hypothetical protein
MEQILAAFRVLSDRSFSCAGEVIETRRDSLLTELKDCLYRLCYTRDFQGVFRPADDSEESDSELLRALQAAHPGGPLQERGWTIEQTHESGKVLASRSGWSRWFLPGHFLAGRGAGVEAAKDDAITIFVTRESTKEQRGYYMAFGETINHEEEHAHVLRFYWNVSLSGAPLLLAVLTRELNRFAVPFMLKCGLAPGMYERSDAAVLYVHRRYYGITARIIAGQYARLADVLEPRTPLFTRRLADGLGFAEDPPGGKSFGMSRCEIVAEALRACHEQALETPEQRLAELLARFRSHGIDPERPYLNPHSSDRYPFPPRP